MRFPKFLQIAALILLAAGAQPAIAAYWQWSKTAATNSGADPSINWAEGMSPSSVNDSARAMMARSAEYRDDISGLLATAGGAVAYTVTTNQGLASVPNDGQLLSFTINATNGVAATLQADGGTVYPIQSSAGVAVASGTLISGSPYSVKFSTANSAWMLKGFYASSTNVPLGAAVPFTGTVVPNSNFIFAAGQCISTTTYATYWVLMGSPASGACPGGQFAVLDAAGRALVGLDTMPGFAAKNRLTSSATGCGTAMTAVGAACANGVEGATIPIGQLPSITSLNAAQAITVYPGGSSANVAPTLPSASAIFTLASGNIPGGAQFYTSINNSVAVTNQNTFSASNSISVTSQSTTNAVRPQVMPAVGLTVILRVL